jgi:hypothetical protein
MIGKELVEDRETLSIFKLKKNSISFERHIVQHYIRVGTAKMRLVREVNSLEWRLDMVERGPKNQRSFIQLVRTTCNYGGSREWFLCPFCSKRVGILYVDKDDFKCRHCLKLSYWSQQLSYRTIAPTLRYLTKLQEMEPPKPYFHNHKLTKRAMRYEKIKAKAEIGLTIFGKKYAKY